MTGLEGNRWTPDSAEKAAHPNSRFTAPASQCPSISTHWEDPQGVPISAIIFGGRRAHVAPLVYQSFDWNHGVFVGASAASETTAAATGAVGVVRRDPMAMLPFCGYNMGDYWAHWIKMGTRSDKMPKIFHVNWFRLDTTATSSGQGTARTSAFSLDPGAVPWRWRGGRDPDRLCADPEGIDRTGLDVTEATMQELLSVDSGEWKGEIAGMREFFAKFESKLPAEMSRQADGLEKRLGA